MGLFTKQITCPECRSPQALKTLKGIKCSNPGCKNYDSSISLKTPSTPVGQEFIRKRFEGNFDPGENTIEINYRNYLSQNVTYQADKRTVRFKKNHISICVVPTGRRISLAKKFIKNFYELKEIEKTQIQPTPRERQVLNYHKKHGTSSPLYEQIRRKYPEE